MRQIQSLLLFIIIIVVASCDYPIYVAVRNYKEPVKISVKYVNNKRHFTENNDTLLLKKIHTSKYERSLIRQNSSDSTYSFIAPQGKEVALQPVAFGTPIVIVKIISSQDSILTVSFRNEDRNKFKQLKKAGVILTKGFLLPTSIIIQNK